MSYREIAFEVSCVLAWSEKARLTYVEALEDYRRAGCPPIPFGARNVGASCRRPSGFSGLKGQDPKQRRRRRL